MARCLFWAMLLLYQLQIQTLGKSESKRHTPLLQEINFTYLNLHYHLILMFLLHYKWHKD